MENKDLDRLRAQPEFGVLRDLLVSEEGKERLPWYFRVPPLDPPLESSGIVEHLSSEYGCRHPLPLVRVLAQRLLCRAFANDNDFEEEEGESGDGHA